MGQPTLRDVQLVELCIAKEIKRICTKHNIRYFMSDGTLLGAVRHQGFIPWDDDMDFGMPLADYNKFLSVAKEELSDDFFLQHVTTDSGYIMPYAKVRMNGTKIYEAVAVDSKMHCGIWVDIFPFVSVEKKKIDSPLFFKKANLLMTTYLLKNGYDLNAVTKSKLKRLVKSMLKYLPISKATLRRYVFSFLQDSSEESSHCMKIRAVLGKQFVFPKECFHQFVQLQFEGETFSAPMCYDKVLTEEYGDYMVIPEESKRKNHMAVSIEIDDVVLQKVRMLSEKE